MQTIARHLIGVNALLSLAISVATALGHAATRNATCRRKAYAAVRHAQRVKVYPGGLLLTKARLHKRETCNTVFRYVPDINLSEIGYFRDLGSILPVRIE